MHFSCCGSTFSLEIKTMKSLSLEILVVEEGAAVVAGTVTVTVTVGQQCDYGVDTRASVSSEVVTLTCL